MTEGSGTWSMESMHGVLLDGESQAASGEIVGRIDAEAKNVGCLQSLSLEFLFQTFFFGQRFSGLVRLQIHVNSKPLSTSFDLIEISTKLHE